MNIEKNQIDALNLQVTVSVAAADYAAAEKKRLNDRRKTADLKGFRKGMAPMSLIQRMFGEQSLVEAVNEVVSEALNNIVKENNLRLVGDFLPSEDQPELDWKSGNDFVFKFDLAQTPEVNFEVSKDDKVPYYEIEVSEVAKKEMKENMLRQVGSLQEGETAGEEDFVIADLSNGEVKADGSYISVRSVAGEAKNLFLGAKSGDQFDINVNEAFTDESDRAAMLKVKKEDLASLNPQFHVTIVNVKTFVSAEEGQEAYDKIFGEGVVKSAEEFDKAVEQNLAGNYKQEADYRFSEDARKYFVEKAGIELPEAFLKRWLLHVNEGKFTLEDIEKEFDSFLSDFRWQMVRGFLMQKYSLTVEAKDIQEAAEAFISYRYAMYGMSNVPQDMLKEGAKNILSDERQARQIEENVESQKVLTAIRENVTLDTKKVTVEQFRDLK